MPYIHAQANGGPIMSSPIPSIVFSTQNSLWVSHHPRPAYDIFTTLEALKMLCNSVVCKPSLLTYKPKHCQNENILPKCFSRQFCPSLLVINWSHVWLHHMTVTWRSHDGYITWVTWQSHDSHMMAILHESHDSHMTVTWQSHDGYITWVTWQSHDSHLSHMTVTWWPYRIHGLISAYAYFKNCKEICT